MERRWPTVLRGLLSAAALGLLVVAVPILLVREVGWPLPTALPSWGEVSHTIATGTIADATIIKALAVLVWLSWASFSSGVVVEAVAIAHGRGARRVVGLRTAQQLAANLLATVSVAVALLGRPTVAAAAEPSDLRLAVATATAEQPPQYLDLKAHEAPASGAASGASPTATGRPVDGEPPRATPSMVYEVQRKDTLWDIADRVHGDGMRWREIRDHNVGREQPDGSRIGPDTEELRAGWTLLLPSAGSSAPAVDASEPDEEVDADADADVAVVEPGDTLWDLADEHLEDPRRWPEIYQENRGDPQPDGGALIDRDHIHPGWVLNLPPAPAVETPSGEPSSVDEIIELPGLPDGWQTDATPADAPADAPPESPIVPLVAPADAPSSPPTAPDTGATVTDIERLHAEQVERSAASEQDAIALVPVAVGGTLAAGFVLTLDRLRRARRRRRQPHHRIPLPEGREAAAEQQLRAQADPAAARLLNLALRELSGHQPTPRAVLVSQGPADVTVHFDSASDAPPHGWQCHDGDRMWSRHRPVNLDSLETHAGVPSRFPALVTVGELPAGRVGLLNLARTGCLHLDGEAHVVQRLLAAWALELATTPRADGLEVVTIGFAGPSADLERITHLDDASQLSELLTQPHSNDPTSVSRTVVLAAGLPADVNVLLRTTSEFRPDLVAVTVDLEPRSGDWSLRLEPGGRARLEPEGSRFDLLDLGGDAVPMTAKLIEQALHDPDQLVRFPEVDASDVPPLDGRDDDGGDEPVVSVEEAVVDEPVTEVRVLGPVEVAGTVQPFRTNKAIELIVYLALHRPGAGADTLLEALWPEQAPRPARLHTEVSRARKSLGTALDGSPHLPDAELGRYRLADSVGVDHERFTAEVVAARRDSGRAVDHLRAALMLVRGAPLSATTTEYAWATNEVYGLIQEVVDAAHDLAQRSLDAERYDDAVWAAERGLLADPLAEVLIRDLMKAAAATANTARVHAVMTRLRRQVADDGDGNDADDWLHPETVELFESLTSTVA